MTDTTHEPDQGVQDRAVLALLRTIQSDGRQAAIDAREARDGMLRLTAVIGEQRYGERLERLKSELDAGLEKTATRIVTTESGLRQDFVAAIRHQDEKRDKALSETFERFLEASAERSRLEERLQSLEMTRTTGEGRSGVFSWVADHGGWLFGAGGVLAWLFHWKSPT